MTKVVFHLNDLAKWSMLFANLNNLIQAQASLEIKVVVNGPAVSGYFATESLRQFTQLTAQGIHFYACQQALKAQGLLATNLPDEIKTVTYGVEKLVSLQSLGAAYIKV